MIRVLLADDQTLVRSGLRMILKSGDAIDVVGEAADGAEALTLARELRPDVVLMDVRMPVMDGIEATRQIKERFPSTSVLAHSAFGDLDQMEAMREAGAVGYVLKDAPAEELIMRLQDSFDETPVSH